MDPPAQHESEIVLYVPPSDSSSQRSESLHTSNNKNNVENEHVSPPRALDSGESIDPLNSSSTHHHGVPTSDRKLPLHSVFQDIVDEFNESSVLAGALVAVDQDETQEGQSCSQEGQELAMKEYYTNTTTVVTKYENMLTGFDHCFVKVPWKERLSVLFATLRRSSDRKVIVIFSSWESCQFHTILFRQLEMLQLFNLHENLTNVAQSYIDFTYFYPGTLFASELAMREFDVPPDVDYIVQFEPPSNPTEYIYRMNTAKISKASSHMALLFLTSEEMTFLEYFDDDMDIKELEARKISEIQRIAVKLVSKHDDLNELASSAFRAFMSAYKNHAFGDVFDYTKIQKGAVRQCFGEPHLPEDLVECFEYNQGAETESTEEKTQSMRSTQQQEPHQWMKKEKTWRKGHTTKLQDDQGQSQHQRKGDEKSRRKEQGDGDRCGHHRKDYPWLVKQLPSEQRQSLSEDVSGESQKPHPWMKKEKTWRSRQTKQWMSKDDKTWKHTHVNL